MTEVSESNHLDRSESFSPSDFEAYDADLMSKTKAAFLNESFFKEHNLTKGLQALGTIRVVFVHWDRALQQLKAHPDNAHMAALLNKHYAKISDLIEVVNAEVIANQQPSIVEGKTVPLLSTEVLLSEVGPENISATTEARLIEIKAQLTNLKTEEDTMEDLLARVSQVERLKTEYDALADVKFYPARYVEKKKSLETAISLLENAFKEVLTQAEAVASDTAGSKVIGVESVANSNFSPRWPEIKDRLIHNRALAAALVLATISVLSPNKLSEYGTTEQATSIDIGSGLHNIGRDAKWAGGEVSRESVAVVDGTGEAIRIPVRPYTGVVVDKEAAGISAVTRDGLVLEEAGVMQEQNLQKNSLAEDVGPKISEIDTPNIMQLPITLGVINEADVAPVIATPIPTTPIETVLETASKETISPNETNTTSDSIIEVLAGDQSTYPDRAIDTVFAKVDDQGLPEVLLTKLKAHEKTAFLSDRERLIRAGIVSGEKNTTFPGEKINYNDPKESLERAVAENVSYLNVPHTEVALEGDDLTKLTLKSFNNDLQVVPESTRLAICERALTSYLVTSGALEALRLTDKDEVKAGDVIPLQSLAPFLAAAVANYVRDTTAAESSNEAIAVVDEIIEESGGVTEVSRDDTTIIENYPGGIVAYSKVYNEKLESLGIAPKALSMIDSWFTQQTPDNRALLKMTVGELNKIMLQENVEVLRELGVRNITLPSANRVNEFITNARRRGTIPYEIDSNLTIADLIQAEVLAETSKSRN